MDHTKTILVIDNDETTLEAMSIRLEDQGYACLIARTGSEGIAMFMENEVDLVITDLNMPGYDGIALAESVREAGSVPVILMTAYPTSYEGSWDHLPGVLSLTKPFAWNTMMHLVENELSAAS